MSTNWFDEALAETPAPERAETDGCASLGDALRRLAENVDRNETERREIKARLDASIARYAEIAHSIVDVLMGGDTHHE